jgi:hypothetical protein
MDTSLCRITTGMLLLLKMLSVCAGPTGEATIAMTKLTTSILVLICNFIIMFIHVEFLKLLIAYHVQAARTHFTPLMSTTTAMVSNINVIHIRLFVSKWLTNHYVIF